MSLLYICAALVIALAIRIITMYVQARHIERFAYDLETHRDRYWLALAIDLVTWLGFTLSTIYILQTQLTIETAWWLRITATFLGWWGVALLSKFPLHKFRRTTAYEMEADFLTNLILSVLSAIFMTSVYIIYSWWRG